MKTQDVLDPQRWAEITFGPARLKDMRRTKRAVITAAQMARDASASLPHQMQTWKDVKALYRLLDEPDVTFEALMQPHWKQTRACSQAEAVVLLVQDTTELDLSHRAKISGIGQIGNAKGRGLFLQTVLAREPESRYVLSMHGAEALCPYSSTQQRATLSAPSSRAQGNGCVDADGRASWFSASHNHAGACRRARSG